METPDIIEDAALYISEHKYPDGCSNSRKRQIRAEAEKLVLKNDELYYNPGKNKPVLIIIIILDNSNTEI